MDSNDCSLTREEINDLKQTYRQYENAIERLRCEIDEKRALLGDISLIEDIRRECLKAGIKLTYGTTTLDMVRALRRDS